MLSTDAGEQLANNASNTTFTPNNGSSPAEIYALWCVTPSLHLIPSILNCVQLSYNFSSFSYSVLLNSVLLLVLTVWSSMLYMILLCMVCMVIYLVRAFWKHMVKSCQGNKNVKPLTWKTFKELEVNFNNGNIPYLEDFRGHLLHSTALSILAVDFDIFPRRFSKTTVYGFSAMDAGVGMFIGVHAIFDPRAKGRPMESLKKGICSSIPLVVLGFLRLAAVTAVNYHVSISEYGVHWNFFFTLALTKLIGSFLSSCFPGLNPWAVAVIVTISHQWLLTGQNLTEYILLKERHSLLDKNKEGVFSLLGFLVIYFACVEIGKLLWKPRSKMKQYINLMGIFTILWIVGGLATYLLHTTVQPSSRRLANVTYCVWVISLFCLEIVVHLFQHLLLIACRAMSEFPDEKPSTVMVYSHPFWKSVNYNGLLYFLLANILTGLVNLSIETSNTSIGVALLVLFSYITALTELARFLHCSAWQVKFW